MCIFLQNLFHFISSKVLQRHLNQWTHIFFLTLQAILYIFWHRRFYNHKLQCFVKQFSLHSCRIRYKELAVNKNISYSSAPESDLNIFIVFLTEPAMYLSQSILQLSSDNKISCIIQSFSWTIFQTFSYLSSRKKVVFLMDRHLVMTVECISGKLVLKKTYS